MIPRKRYDSVSLLPVAEAARLLSIHVNTARRWGNRGVLKYYRVGPRGDRRFSREDIVTILKNR
jgi:excisionase family DNA binding protein